MSSEQVSRRTVALNIVPLVVIAGVFAVNQVGVEALGLVPVHGSFVLGAAFVAAAAVWGMLWRRNGVVMNMLCAVFSAAVGLVLVSRAVL